MAVDLFTIRIVLRRSSAVRYIFRYIRGVRCRRRDGPDGNYEIGPAGR